MLFRRKSRLTLPRRRIIFSVYFLSFIISSCFQVDVFLSPEPVPGLICGDLYSSIGRVQPFPVLIFHQQPVRKAFESEGL
jgi:hypothetical protein